MESQQSVIRSILANRAYEVWEPKAAPPPTRTGEGGWKAPMRAMLARMPRAPRVFAPDFLKSWRSFKLRNLVFLRKTAADNRDWRFHRRF
jgi:hypothetical protein